MKSLLKLTAVLLFSVVVTSCNAQEKSKVNEKEQVINVISPNDFSKMATNQVVVDVRTPKEYQEGHIENAKNINFYDDNFLDQFANYNKEEPVFIYCKSGGRSGKAAKKLSDLGFKKVYDLQGGYLNWTKEMSKITE
tara:strand:- start:110 stop:520 length:411 start_codon:yes stop_codon:yes gene_type:complete